jgi:hypothetical protein
MEVSCPAIGAAVWNGDQHKVEAFLKGGADVNAPLSLGYPKGQKFTTYPVCMAIEAVAMDNAGADFLKFLLDRGARVTVEYDSVTPQPDGSAVAQKMTPLALAVTADHAGLVEMLLAHGANPNDPVRPGISVLSFAEARRQAAVAKVLREHGATK